MSDTTVTTAEAERAVLGVCLVSGHAARTAVGMLTGREFDSPAYGIVFEAIARVVAAGRSPDLLVVADDLADNEQLAAVGGRAALVSLSGGPATAGNVDYYAERVMAASRARAVQQTAHQVLGDLDTGRPVEDVVDDAHAAFGALRYGPGGDDLATTFDLDEFVDQDLPDLDWVVPDLLAKGDRLVVTGSEGLGKSTLIRQIAVAVAAGVNPFTLTPTAPRSVLVVDAENPLRIMATRFGELREAARTRGTPVPRAKLWIDRRPDGLDLASKTDQRWLSRRVEAVNPDLLVIGPAYKLYVGGAGAREEDLARIVTSVLDRVRESVGCALILEHHSPHATGGMVQRATRPIGSSLWLRWPEFGIGIRMADIEHNSLKSRVVDVEHWRGARDERTWPERLRAGGHGWPWVEAEPSTRWH